MLNPVAIAIPFFFLLIGIEAWVGRKKGWYRWNDVHADLGAGVIDQVLSALFAAALFGPYRWVWEHARLLTIPDGLFALALAVVLVDFVYYGWHRASHRIAWMWASHSVHHQSNEYNLAVALRQDAFSKFTSWVLYLPLAVLGVSPAMALGALSIDLLYQFWIHTRAIGKLGAFERVFNTASHHRVHHAANRRYIDRNYGGIFIVFDRMFGTFVEEAEEPDYGTVEPFESWNPVWANLSPILALWEKSAETPGGLLERLRVWWRPPEWLPGGAAYPFPSDAELRARPRYDADMPAQRAWMILNWVGVAAATVWLLARPDEPTFDRVLVGGIVVVTLATLGGMLDGRAWAHVAERVREVGVIFAVIWWIVR